MTLVRERVGAVQLVATGLGVAYGSEQVVRDVDLQIEPGRVTALIGPNGSGKSTVLRSLARLHDPCAGSIECAGEAQPACRIDALSRKEFARSVAMLGQHRPTPDGVRVSDVVAFGRHPYSGRFRSADPDGPAKVDDAMRTAGVAAIADRRIDQLSGGQVQRVWLACCLAQDTAVLLLDEPTNHLDLRYQAEMLDLIVELAESGVAVGVVLHDLNHAAAIADRVIVLSEGRVVADGDARAVMTSALLSEVYGLPIDAADDPVTGERRIEVRRVRSRIRPAVAG